MSELRGKTIETVVCGPRTIIVTAPDGTMRQAAIYVQTNKLMYAISLRKRQLARTIEALQRVHDAMVEEEPTNGWTMPSPSVKS